MTAGMLPQTPSTVDFGFRIIRGGKNLGHRILEAFKKGGECENSQIFYREHSEEGVMYEDEIIIDPNDGEVKFEGHFDITLAAEPFIRSSIRHMINSTDQVMVSGPDDHYLWYPA